MQTCSKHTCLLTKMQIGENYCDIVRQIFGETENPIGTFEA